MRHQSIDTDRLNMINWDDGIFYLYLEVDVIKCFGGNKSYRNEALIVCANKYHQVNWGKEKKETICPKKTPCPSKSRKISLWGTL